MASQPLALITGAAHGIGNACATVFHRQGYRVVLTDINIRAAEQHAEALGSGAYAVACDMGDPAQIQSMFDLVASKSGPATVLVNNAGIVKPAPFLDMTVDDFKEVLDVNLVGAFAATQCAARAMIAARLPGAVVNMSSINAQVAIPSIASYCASKGGLMQMTKAAALALAPHGIRVNAVGPGSIDTAMVASVNEDPSAMARAMSRTPLQRLGTPEEVAETVAFLASDKASYITGETIYIDGGRLALNYTC